MDNTSIFDPQLADPIALQEKGEKFGDRSPFERISSPVAESGGEPNDIFCSGHLQLPQWKCVICGWESSLLHRACVPGLETS